MSFPYWQQQANVSYRNADFISFSLKKNNFNLWLTWATSYCRLNAFFAKTQHLNNSFRTSKCLCKHSIALVFVADEQIFRKLASQKGLITGQAINDAFFIQVFINVTDTFTKANDASKLIAQLALP